MPPTTAPHPPDPPAPPDRCSRFRLSSPGDLLAAVPYLLGFHPADSLVLVGIRHRQVAVTFRVDLPDPAPPDALPPGALPADLVECQLDHLVDVLDQHRPVRVVLVGYGPADRVEPLVASVRASLAAHEVPVLDALRVDGDRYWPLLATRPTGVGPCCDGPGCHGPAGVGPGCDGPGCDGPVDGGLPWHADGSPVAAAATVAGLVALPDRAELARRVAPVAGAARVAMERATHHAEVRWGDLLSTSADLAEVHDRVVTEGLAAVRTAATRYRPPAPEGLSDEEMAWLGLVLGVPRVREEAWGLADTADAAGQLALWTSAVRRLEGRYLAPAASLLAFVAWQVGEGAFATVAVDRALATDPDHPMAQLLAQALAAGLPPSSWHPASPAELSRLDAPPTRPVHPATGTPPRRWRVRLRRAVRR